MKKKRYIIIIIFIFLFIVTPPEANAYLDPGTGSYILQIIISVVLGALFAIKLFWNKVKSFFFKLFSKNK